MKKRLLYLLLSLTLLIAVCIPTTVAWFMRGDRTDMTLELLEINSLVTLYRANDGNLNGVPDLAPSSVAMKYYTEPYYFVDPVSDYAQSADAIPTEVKMKLEMPAFLPGSAYTFKFAIENNSDADNLIRLEMDTSGTTDSSGGALLRALSVRAVEILRPDGEGNYRLDYENSRKVYLADAGTGSITEVFSSVLPGVVSAQKNGDATVNFRDYWLIVTLEPRETVNAHIRSLNTEREAAGETLLDEIDEATYNALAGQTLTGLALRLVFDVTSDLIHAN